MLELPISQPDMFNYEALKPRLISGCDHVHTSLPGTDDLPNTQPQTRTYLHFFKMLWLF